MTDKQIDKLILDSLFLALSLNNIYYHNNTKKIARITCKAWKRHWRRVQLAIDASMIDYKIPNDVTLDCSKYEK